MRREKTHAYLSSLSAKQKLDLAERIGTRVIYLVQIAGGHSDPSARFARKLSEATKGACPLWELCPDLWSPPKQRKRKTAPAAPIPE